MTPGMKLMLFLFLWISMQIMGDYAYSVLIAVFAPGDVSNIDFTSPFMQLSRLGVSTLFAYTMTFYLYGRLTKEKFKSLFHLEPLKLKYFGISLIVLLAGMFAMSYLLDFNRQLIDLIPNNPLIEMQLEREIIIAELFEQLTPLTLILAVIVMAIIPAILEELMFRGFLIGKLMSSTNNLHFSVLISALLFAGIHLQPLNILPILFMGLCFGYIYVYFKNIWYTIILHFINNLLFILVPYFS